VVAALARDTLPNSWYSNTVNKRALIESHGLTLHDAHALGLFKNGRAGAGDEVLQGSQARQLINPTILNTL
jgi:hypothetical protein